MPKAPRTRYMVELINDAFAAAHLHWMHACPLNAESCLLQYESSRHGTTRVVHCTASALLRWLHQHNTHRGWKQELVDKLDRKPPHEAPLRQQELDLHQAPALARRSMAPGE